MSAWRSWSSSACSCCFDCRKTEASCRDTKRRTCRSWKIRGSRGDSWWFFTSLKMMKPVVILFVWMNMKKMYLHTFDSSNILKYTTISTWSWLRGPPKNLKKYMNSASNRVLVVKIIFRDFEIASTQTIPGHVRTILIFSGWLQTTTMVKLLTNMTAIAHVNANKESQPTTWGLTENGNQAQV